MEKRKFRRLDRVHDEKYGNGTIVEIGYNCSRFDVMVEFKSGQYFTYDREGFRAFPESREPVLTLRY